MEKTMIAASLPWSNGSGFSYKDRHTELAASIVLQAVKDYIKVLRSLLKNSTSAARKRMLILEKNELEAFFYSEWYGFLTDLDPDRLLSGCQERAQEQEKERIRKQNKKKLKKMQEEKGGNT